MIEPNQRAGESGGTYTGLQGWRLALDAVDSHREATALMNTTLADGFFALSREQMSCYTAMLRLSSDLFDSRDEVKASLRVTRNEDGSLSLFDSFASLSSDFQREANDADFDQPQSSGLRHRKRSEGHQNEDTKYGAGCNKEGALATERLVPRQTKLRHTLHALPSAALREAAGCFEKSISEAIAVANLAAVTKARLAEVHCSDLSMEEGPRKA